MGFHTETRDSQTCSFLWGKWALSQIPNKMSADCSGSIPMFFLLNPVIDDGWPPWLDGWTISRWTVLSNSYPIKSAENAWFNWLVVFRHPSVGMMTFPSEWSVIKFHASKPTSYSSTINWSFPIAMSVYQRVSVINMSYHYFNGNSRILKWRYCTI